MSTLRSRLSRSLGKANGESRRELFERICAKSDIPQQERAGTCLVYEFEGERWSLDDDDDLRILLSRFPPTTTPSVTLHLKLPHSRPAADLPREESSSLPNIKSKKRGTPRKEADVSGVVRDGSPSASNIAGHVGTRNLQPGQVAATRSVSGFSTRSVAKSFVSTVSRHSKWGDPNSEPLGDVKRREWEDFHASNGVRTVMGNVAGVPHVRMLLKSGYKHVYISRKFALKHKLIDKKSLKSGYSGLLSISSIPITVGSRTTLHPTYLSEEPHFDVVLGRDWVEKMGIKIDPLDPTLLMYMDTGEPIHCETVILRDEKGNVVTIT
nr:hypothetical protein L203_05043 [Cryptococcus depauperatus CBS 7841]